MLYGVCNYTMLECGGRDLRASFLHLLSVRVGVGKQMYSRRAFISNVASLTVEVFNEAHTKDIHLPFDLCDF